MITDPVPASRVENSGVLKPINLILIKTNCSPLLLGLIGPPARPNSCLAASPPCQKEDAGPGRRQLGYLRDSLRRCCALFNRVYLSNCTLCCGLWWFLYILRFCLVDPVSKNNVNPKIYNALSGELVRSKLFSQTINQHS